jgi:hypothetical protein
VILEAAILGLVVGLFARGSFRSILHKRFQHLWLVFASIACELFVSTGLMGRLLLSPGADGSAPLFADETLPLVAFAVLQYGMLAAFLLLNFQKPGLRLVLVGSLMNAAAVLANGGRMPVGPALATSRYYGQAAIDRIASAPNYVYAPDGAPLGFLGDILPVWLLSPYMVSPGDFLIALGAFLFAWYLVRRPRPVRKR